MWRVCLVDRDGTFRFYPWISKPVDLFGYTSADGWGGPGEELLIIGWMHIRELNSLAPLAGRFFMLLGILSISRSAYRFIVRTKVGEMRLGAMQHKKQYGDERGRCMKN